MPVPPSLTLRLPPRWRVQEPPAGLDLVALHETPDEGFTATITLAMDAVEGADDVAQVVTAMADGAVERLAAVERDVTVHRRGAIGPASAPGLAQEVRLVTTVGEGSVRLTQVQVYLPAPDLSDDDRLAVYSLTFTATAAQAPELAPDFEALVRSVRPEVPGAAPEG
ncbi:hypothetical protein GXB85_17230 [Cellulomonas sp. APG4]|uniref:hypothetical protein n=1 Tax=Cellulomonas sp. APG4 TaxID=1538656 RepID=UPI00137A5EB9|nr:hypothetical protein [Cellulomonas sp. APG4]NCT92679.1 hypothetical protein [Cellulomonas sp. APG4]